MSFQTAKSKTSTYIKGLGKLDGLRYENGVEQFCGIPYARLSKRWTRSTLCTSWENDYHDGTQLGNSCPEPQSSSPDNPFIPVPPNPNFVRQPQVDEKSALVLNIVVPPRLSSTTTTSGSSKSTLKSKDKTQKKQNQPFPILLWIHGGSLLHGSSNYSIYDAVNLVSHSLTIGKPIIVVTFNYRIGLGGFLACKAIKEELARDGFAGNGNFGFTDQRVASEWVRKYLCESFEGFAGDVDNVTVFGQSAGAVSIGHHLVAARVGAGASDSGSDLGPGMIFHRAVCMSGLGSTLSCLEESEHEEIFLAICRFFGIEVHSESGLNGGGGDEDAAGLQSQVDALEKLRAIPEQVLANADPIIQDAVSGTGYPCFDGWFYARDPRFVTRVPDWLRSFLIGDVKDEGLMFEMNLWNDHGHHDTYTTIRETLLDHVQDVGFVDAVLGEYGITSDEALSTKELIDRTCEMGAEAVFKIQNYETALVNEGGGGGLDGRLFKYHFDQRSRLPNVLRGKAYHGLDVLYLFMNLDDKLNDEERRMSRDLASAWISFAWGEAPWMSGIGHGPWKIWGPNSEEKVQTEDADEVIRSYSRFDRLIKLGCGGLWQKYMKGLAYLLMKRGNLGKFSVDADSGEDGQI